jgi:alanine racemase
MTTQDRLQADPDARPNAMHVDLGAIGHNVRELRRGLVGGGTFVAALKANAYGFGLEAVAPVVLAAGADRIAVAAVDDAIALRRQGITAPLMLYGGTRPSARVLGEIVEHDLAATVVDDADVDAYARARARLRVLLKVDVGLERLGAEPPDAARIARRIAESPDLVLEGLYTHLHVPKGSIEEVTAYADWQYQRFTAVLDELDRDGIDVPIRMAASSGALRLTDRMNLNAIDVGSLLYGLEPPGPLGRPLDLRPAMLGLTTRLSQVRPRHRHEFKAQSPIPTDREIQLGVIPMGATDGLLGLSSGQVLIRGRRATVLAVSLEHARLDVSGIDDAVAGDEVVIIGRQGDDEITMRDVAVANGLYSPAVTPVLIARHVPRVYTGG